MTEASEVLEIVRDPKTDFVAKILCKLCGQILHDRDVEDLGKTATIARVRLHFIILHGGDFDMGKKK